MNKSNKEYIHIPDPRLAKLIRGAIGLDTDEPISVESLTSVEKLTAVYFYVSDLTGIEHLTELKMLHLYSNNEIEDIRPLANLNKLTHLNLSDNKIKDISPLSGLMQLQTLFLNINEISDFTPIAGLQELRSLYLGTNPIQDLSHIYRILRRFPLLISLSMNRLQISNDISQLSEFTQLSELSIEGCQINDITPLSRLVKLRRLCIANNNIRDVSIIENFPSLSSLSIKGNPIQDMTPIYKLCQQNPNLKLDIVL